MLKKNIENHQNKIIKFRAGYIYISGNVLTFDIVFDNKLLRRREYSRHHESSPQAATGMKDTKLFILLSL